MTELITRQADAKVSVLFVFCSSPQAGTTARDGLDTLLAFAAFDTRVAVAFSGEGVWQLCREPLSHHAETKPFTKMLQVLPLYDITDIYVHKTSLQSRGMRAENLALENISLINDNALSELLRQYTHVFRF